MDTDGEREPTPPPPPKPAVRHTIGGRKKAPATGEGANKAVPSSSKPPSSTHKPASSLSTVKGDSQDKNPIPSPKNAEYVPPTRALPFTNKAAATQESTTKSAPVESDSETDDEL
jgi:hypothetical protein